MDPMDEEPSSPGPPPLEDQNGMEVTAPVQKSAKAVQVEIRQRIQRQKERKSLNLTALNPYIVCALCKGYLIDPVSVVECLHSFCKSCIVKHVETSKFCPTCDVQIHKTKPLLSLRSDKALQDIVYKVVPGLYRSEMKNRVNFYSTHPEAEPANLEDAGEVSDRLFFSPEDDISMSLEYFDSFSKADEMKKHRPENLAEENPNRRFLQCPGSVTVHHLKKFIMTKYGLDQNFLVDVIYKEDLLPEDQTLIDIAYSYNWRKTSPMQFYYRIYQKTKVLTRKRKKKRTKAGSKNQPPRKKMNIDHNWNGTEANKESAMEVDSEPIPKLSSKLEKSVTDKSNKLKITIPRDSDKKSKTESPALSKSERKISTSPQSVLNDKKTEKPVPKPILTKTPNLPATNKPSPVTKPLTPVQTKPAPSVSTKSNTPSSNTTISSVKVTPAESGVGQGTNPIKNPSNSTSKKTVTVSKTLISSSPTQLTSQNNKNVSTKLIKPPTESPALGKTVEAPQNSPPVNGLKTAGSANTSELKASAKTKVSPKNVDVKVSAYNSEPKELTTTSSIVNKVDRSPCKFATAEKKKGEKEVVEISVEVSASDVKKVLEKKRAEKDAKLLTSGEDKLYSNYSIVDQIKKAGSSAANLARQQTERASMMDFARSSEALNPPKMHPTIQGLQPKVTSSSEANGLSAIVQSLAQKQQKLQAAESTDLTKESFSALSATKYKDSTAVDSSKSKQSETTKTLGNMVAPALTTKTTLEKPNPLKAQPNPAPKLPTSTSIKPILKDGKQSPTSVETSGAKGQQMLNFYKNSFNKPGSLSDAAKSAETLTKNIPAGTTVTVKTVENKNNGKSSPVSSPSPVPPSSSPKNSAFKMNLSNTNFANSKVLSNPFAAAVTSQPSLINPFVHSSLRDSMTMAALAAQQAQYLNFSNQGFSAALAAAQMDYVQAVRAAQISQSSLTTLEFTKPGGVSSDEGRFGLKIPTPTLGRHHNPAVSGFGTSRLQVKVNSDTPKEGSPGSKLSNSPSPPTSLTVSTMVDASGSPTITSNGKTSGTHCMPAILPFHSVKKVQALPKSVGQSPRPGSVPSLLKGETNTPPPAQSQSPKSVITSVNSVQSLTDSNPFKTSAAPVRLPASLESLKKAVTPPNPTTVNNPFKPVTQAQVNSVTQAQVNSLKKLAADLNTAQQKTLKGDNNILNTLKKNQENKLLSFSMDNKKQESTKEVTSS